MKNSHLPYLCLALLGSAIMPRLTWQQTSTTLGGGAASTASVMVPVLLPWPPPVQKAWRFNATSASQSYTVPQDRWLVVTSGNYVVEEVRKNGVVAWNGPLNNLGYAYESVVDSVPATIAFAPGDVLSLLPNPAFGTSQMSSSGYLLELNESVTVGPGFGDEVVLLSGSLLMDPGTAYPVYTVPVGKKLILQRANWCFPPPFNNCGSGLNIYDGSHLVNRSTGKGATAGSVEYYSNGPFESYPAFVTGALGISMIGTPGIPQQADWKLQGYLVDD